MDEWIEGQIDCENMIKFAMKQRKHVNKCYVENLETFDVKRFWADLYEKRNAPIDKEENDDDDDEEDEIWHIFL